MNMVDWSACEALEQEPGKVSGAWIFRGSRIPVSALFENLEDGVNIEQFVELFPGVAIVQVKQVLKHVAQSTVSVA